MQHESGIRGERTAYRDTKVPKRVLGPMRASLRNVMLPGEELLGVFTAYRMSRPTTLLVVTDRRLLTLGGVDTGMAVVDEVDRDAITRLHIEREKILSSGRVVAETALGEINLGTLDYTGDGGTFRALDELLARPRGRTLPVIPVPGTVTGPVEDGVPRDGAPGPAGPPRTHPLVEHLRDLADLHERGALTDEEFTRAKAALLANPQG